MPGFIRWIETPAGRAPVISGHLTFADTLGAWKARWGIGRMAYIVPPGLYAVGSPAAHSPVLVTCNYKMTYDILRKALNGRSLWILVLETYGINVWCAAGKGTFGTGELVRRIADTNLAQIVSHRRLILPLLGAVGVKAVEVARRSGFNVQFGCIFADHLPDFLDNGMNVTPDMRELNFSLKDRLALVPIELVIGLKSLPVVGFTSGLAGAFSRGSFSLQGGFTFFLYAFIGIITGTVVVPLLLPWLPSRSFAVKGALTGLLVAGALLMAQSGSLLWYEAAALMLLMTSISSFFALNFTGSTPFTSRSGVKKEMRLSLPAMAAAAIAGFSFLVIGRFAG